VKSCIVGGSVRQLSYAYDAATGRLATLTASTLGQYRSFTYGYEPGGDQVQQLVSGSFTRRLYWETWRDVVDAVDTQWAGVSKSSFTYGYDWLGQRLHNWEQGLAPQQEGFAYGRKMTYALDPKGQMDYFHANALLADGNIDSGASSRPWRLNVPRNAPFGAPPY
jgi:hypothetical protein